MTPDQDQVIDLDTAIESATEALPVEPGSTEQVQAEVLPPLDAPERWNRTAKESWQALHGYEGSRSHLEALHKQWAETQKYTTQVEQQRAHLERQFSPINELLSPYAQHWAQQGMSADQGLRQMLSYAQALAENPAETLLQLAEQYGVDVRQAIEDQPYVDPVAKAALQRAEQLEQRFIQQEQQSRAAQQNVVLSNLQAFEQAVDADGNPKHPHFADVLEDMILLHERGRAKSPEEAYELAVRLNPDLQAQAAKVAAQQAEKNAIRNAQLRTSQTQQAVNASGALRGKGGKNAPAALSMDESIEEALKEASARAA